MTTGARYVLAFGVPLIVTGLLTPLAIRVAHRHQVVGTPKDDGVHHAGVPLLGGVALASGLMVVGALVAGSSGQLIAVVVGAAAVSLLGLVDDLRSVRPATKVAVEVGAALGLWFAGVGAGLFGSDVLDAGLTVLWVLAVTNAMNLVDNMDGLASGLAAISAFGFFAIAAGNGDYLVASLALATAGAAIGFLLHNFPPAKIFLGDAGSLLLGFLLAALGLKLDLIGESGLVRSAIPILIVAVPLFDTVLVIVARMREGRPVFVGGSDHSSHRLARRGLSARGVAILSYLVQGACVTLAVVLNDSSGAAIVGVSLALSLAGLVALVVLLRSDVGPPVLAPEGEGPSELG